MSIKTIRFFFYSIVALFMSCGPRSVEISQGGSGTETVGIMGNAINGNQQPVAGAAVRLRRHDFLDTTTVRLFKTDTNPPMHLADEQTNSAGKFFFSSVDTGIYFIEINDGNHNAAMMPCTVSRTDSLIVLPNARLLPTGSLFGIIPSTPLMDSITFSIAIYGLADHIQTTNRSGEFTLSDIPQGSYTIKIIPHVPIFKALDTAVKVVSGVVDSIGQFVMPHMSFSIYPFDSCILRDILDSNGLQSVPWQQLVSVGAWPFRITELRLDYKKITTLPSEIGMLKELQTISAQGNYLSSIPKEIGNLRNLKTISLENNRLSSLPGEINKLDSLVNLDVSYNQLSALPDGMDNCRSLEVLNVGYNQITSIPEEVFYCHSLQAVFLCNNSLDSLPESIGLLWNLDRLDVQYNQLWTLPWQITKLHSDHRFVNFDYNELCGYVPQDVTDWLNAASMDTTSWQATQICQ